MDKNKLLKLIYESKYNTGCIKSYEKEILDKERLRNNDKIKVLQFTKYPTDNVERISERYIPKFILDNTVYKNNYYIYDNYRKFKLLEN